MTSHRFVAALAPIAACLSSALGGVAAAADDALLPRPNRVVVVVEENHAFEQVVGRPEAPYIDVLARRGALFTRSYAVSHPSQPNYLALFSGSTLGVSDDDCLELFRAPNLGSRLLEAGLTFAGYSETLPSDGYRGCRFGAYARKHNPWSDFANLPAASTNLRFGEFPSDFDRLPTVAFVVPDLIDDMHDGSVAGGDAWLRRNIDPYVQWADTHDGLLVLTWDEDDKSSGNHIATIFVGPMVKPGRYARRIDHYGVLRTIEEMYGLAPTGEAARRRPVDDVWNTPRFTSPSNAIATVGKPFHLDLATNATAPVTITTRSILPPGLALGPSGIDGTPTQVGSWVIDLYAGETPSDGGMRLRVVVVSDADVDGFANEIEIAAGTDPLSAASIPAHGSLATDGRLVVSRAAIRLRFSRDGGDVASLRGTLALPANFRASEATVLADLGGATATFRLRGNGASLRDSLHPGSALRIASPRAGTTSAFTMRLAGDLRDALGDEGMTAGAASSRPVAVLLTILIDGAQSRAVVPLRWTTGADRGLARE